MLLAWLNPPNTAALGHTQMAMEMASGRVPEGCCGIRMGEDGLFTLYPAGEKVKSESRSRLFWVHPGPYQLRFAPHSDAPEVGVAAQVQAECRDERLGRLLATWDDQVLGLDDLCARVRQIGGPHLLPPAVTQAEIEASGGLLARFSNDLQEFGLRCTALRKIDLGDQVDTEAELWSHIGGLSTPVATEVTRAEPLAQAGDGAVEQRATAELAIRLGRRPISKRDGLPLWGLDDLDRKLIQTLDKELPWLTRRLRQVSLACGDTAIRQQLRQAEDQLVRSTRRVGMLPVLRSNIPALRLDRATRRRRVGELQQASRRFQELRLLLKRLEDHAVAPPPELLDGLDRLVWGLETDLRRRAEGNG